MTNLSGRRVRDLSFTVREGEVLGIGGLAGSGRSELLRILAGAQKHTSGEIVVGQTALRSSPGVGRALMAGLALVPEERRSQGVDLGASIQDNIAIANIPSVSRFGWVSSGRIADITRRECVICRSRRAVRANMSASYRAATSRRSCSRRCSRASRRCCSWTNPRAASTSARRPRSTGSSANSPRAGTAVIAVSSELPELIGMSDRILIMHEGRIAGEVAADVADDELLLSYCYGKIALT